MVQVQVSQSLGGGLERPPHKLAKRRVHARISEGCYGWQRSQTQIVAAGNGVETQAKKATSSVTWRDTRAMVYTVTRRSMVGYAELMRELTVESPKVSCCSLLFMLSRQPLKQN